MFRCCPRPCADLTSAAVFISAGVVQIIAGAILLRSKYVYLLSGPNFWTAAANICVGALVGVAASVWKPPECRKTASCIAKYRLMLSLFISSIIMNVTTATILILGEGNAYLSIYVEQQSAGGEISFATEILAYAFAASVIVPIVCATTSALSILSRCCKLIQLKSPVSKCRRRRKIMTENRELEYSWVYSPHASSMLESSNPECDRDKVPESSPEGTDPNRLRAHLAPCKRSVRYLDSPNTPVTGEIVPVRVTPIKNYKPSIPVRRPVVSTVATLSDSWKETKLSKSNYGTYTVVPRNKLERSSFIANDNSNRPDLVSFRRGGKKQAMKRDSCPELPVVWTGQYSKGLSTSNFRLTPMDSITELPYEDWIHRRSSGQSTGYESGSPLSPTESQSVHNNSVFLKDEKLTTPKKPWTSVGTPNISFSYQGRLLAHEL